MTRNGPDQPALIMQDHYGVERIAPEAGNAEATPATPVSQPLPKSQAEHHGEDHERDMDRLVDQGFTPAMAAGRLGVAKQVEGPQSRSHAKSHRQSKGSSRRSNGVDPDYNAVPWNLR